MSSFLNLLRRDDLRAFFAWWVLFAFLLRAIMPLGYMPDSAKENSSLFPVRICTGDGKGAITIFVDKDLKRVDPSQNHKNHSSGSSCPFSIGTVFSGGSFLSFVVATAVFFAAVYFSSTLFPIRRWRFSNASSRSPPVFP
jgi:hypothetical protein